MSLLGRYEQLLERLVVELKATPEEVAVGSPLFLDLVEDARVLYDPEGFLEGYLDRLRAREQILNPCEDLPDFMSLLFQAVE